MINYSLYCGTCKEFFSTYRTDFKHAPYGRRACPECGESIEFVSCAWMLNVVGLLFGNNLFARQYFVGLDRLEKLCYNCDSRFMCWTNSL